MRRFARGWAFAAAALLLTAGPLEAGSPGSSSSTQTSEAENMVSDLSVEQKDDGTYLRLSSTETPSFSVYKLTDPLRLVVDVSGSQLDSEQQSREVNNGVVSKVALLETAEESASRVRLIVGFATSTHYDVRTDGKDLVIFVEGKPQPKSVAAVRRELERKERKLESLEAELERVRSSYESKLEKARSNYNEAKQQLTDRTERLESLRMEVDELKADLKDARGKTRGKLRARLKRREQSLESLQASLADKRSRVDELESRVETLQREKRDVRAKLDKTRRELKQERQRVKRQSERLASLRKSQKKWQEKFRARKQQQQRAEQQVEQIRGQLEDARAELEALRRDSESQAVDNATLASKRREIQRLRQTLDSRQQRLEALSDKVASLKSDNEATQQKLASLREELATQRKKAQRRADKLESLRDELETEKKKARRRAENLESLREQKSEWSSTLDAKAERLESAQQELSTTRDELETVQKKLDKKDERIARLESRLDDQSVESGKRQVAERLESLKSDVEAQRERAKQLKAARQRQADQLAELRRDRQQMKKKLETARRKLERTRTKLAKARSNNDADSKGPVARAEPVDAAEPNTIRDIRLVQKDGESRIVVELERPGEYRRLPWRDHRAVMLLKNVELPDRLKNTIAASGDSGAVRFVSSKVSQPGQVRMEADVKRSAEERIKQRGSKLVWEFAPSVAPENPARAKSRQAGTGAARASNAGQSAQPQRPDDVQETAAPPGYPQTVIDPSEVNSVPRMASTRMTLDIRNADIQNILRMFAKQGDVNIITGDGVEGQVTITLEEVPLDRAFLIVLQSQGLGFEIRGSVIRVATQEKLRAERKARQEAAQRQQKLEPLEVFLMPINYAEASSLTEQVQRLLSPRGSVSVDERTNTLIIKDLRANIRSIRQLVNTLDTQVPQVLIKARIVEINDTFSREFGIQWGGDFTASQGNGNPTGLAFPNVIGVAGGATDSETNASGTSENPNFAVNLPAPAGTGAGGALGMTLGSIGDSVNLNLRLSAAEESGRAKIVSEPKILTLDNREATISQGTSIPISVVSAAGVQTVFVDATLELTVRPHVTPDGHIQLSLSASKNEPDFQNTGARGDPTIIRRSAETELLIEDGDTTVIGGIYTRNSGTSVTGIPFLHKIPILGALFKTTSRNENRSELLIFITPRIVNRADAFGNVSAGNVVSPSAGGSTGSGGGPSGAGNAAGGGGGNGGGDADVRTRMEP